MRKATVGPIGYVNEANKVEILLMIFSLDVHCSPPQEDKHFLRQSFRSADVDLGCSLGLRSCTIQM